MSQSSQGDPCDASEVLTPDEAMERRAEAWAADRVLDEDREREHKILLEHVTPRASFALETRRIERLLADLFPDSTPGDVRNLESGRSVLLNRSHEKAS